MLAHLETEIEEAFSRPFPFSADDLRFDYDKVPAKYHAAAHPNLELVLFKGAPTDHAYRGFLSNAIVSQRLDHLWEVRTIIEMGSPEEIFNLLHRHTSYYSYTPLLSATFNPENAQVFASTSAWPRPRVEKTIYQLHIDANRCIIDADNTGGAGKSKELLILGAIFPSEITAVKLVNDHWHSELYDEERGIVPYLSDYNSTNRQVRDPTNWLNL